MQYTNTPQSPAEPRPFRPSSDRPMAMLKICPAYAPTPLIGLQSLAGECGVGTLSLKDESQRMRLGSFKALGGAFAVAQMHERFDTCDDVFFAKCTLRIFRIEVQTHVHFHAAHRGKVITL